MKKILLLVCVMFSLVALGQDQATRADYDDDIGSPLSQNANIVTYTSEPCGLDGKSGVLVSGVEGTQTARYRCTIEGANGFIKMISDIYKYVFFISLILGVLYLVMTGLALALSGAFNTEEAKEWAKTKALNVFGGLMALALVPWILKTVAPFFFN